MTESNTPDGAEQDAQNASEQTSPAATTPTGPTEVIEPAAQDAAETVPLESNGPTSPIEPQAPAAPVAPAVAVTPPAAAAPTTPVAPVAPAAPAPADAAPAAQAPAAAAPAPVAAAPVAAPAAPVAAPAAAAAPHHAAHAQATDAFGQPVTPAATVYAPGTAPQPYAQQTQPTQPYIGIPAAGPGGGNAGNGGSGTPGATATKRRATLPIVAALIAGALIGGASGVGVAAVLSSNNDSTQSSTSAEPQNVVVNNTDSVNEITAVAAKASPSVVTISVSSDSGAGTGSGIVLSKDGYVLTNTHVVTLDGSASDTQIQVQMSDGTLYAAKLVGTDPVSDLAVIKLTDASGLTPLAFADSSKLNVGDSAVAIGAPLGLAGTVTNGIVSALNRSIQVASSAAPDSSQDSQTPNDDNGQGGDSPFNFWNLPDDGSGQQQTQTQATSTISLPVIQTDAAINPGNSGGALLNSKGELIGVNVAIASAGATTEGSQSGSIGVGFAIPANLAERIANEIITDGKASHGLLGASVQDATSAKAGVVGALIKEVVSGGSADKGGLKAGDIVTDFNGVPISNATDLTAQVRYLAGGDKADLSYVRDGKTATTTVTLGEYTAG